MLARAFLRRRQLTHSGHTTVKADRLEEFYVIKFFYVPIISYHFIVVNIHRPIQRKFLQICILNTKNCRFIIINSTFYQNKYKYINQKKLYTDINA